MTKIIACGLYATLIASCSFQPGSPQQAYGVGRGPGLVALVDVNGDTRLDIVVANEGSGDVSILLGDGKGAFSTAASSTFSAGPNPNDVTVGDFNGDGRPDLAFANHETQYVTVLFGDGRGGFISAPGSPFPVAVRPHPHGIATGDFDGDGCLDLVTDSWAEDRLEILFNDCKGGYRQRHTYVPVGRHPYQRIRVADLNGDAKADIVSTNLDGNDVTILLGTGKGTFIQPGGSPFSCGDSPFNVAVGDINADGHPDLAIVNSPSSAVEQGKDGLTLLLGDGRGHFRPQIDSPFPLERFPNTVAVGDLGGDGIGDVVVSNPESDYITVFKMAKNGHLAVRERLRVQGHPKGLAIGDFNADGKGDIVVTNNSANTVTVILSQ